MNRDVLMSSGQRELSPALQELVDQTVELMKVATIQGLAAQREPQVFAFSRATDSSAQRNPGRVVARYLAQRRGGANGSPEAVDDVLEKLYDADVRRLVRRHNVDLGAATSALDQQDRAARFGFVQSVVAAPDRLEGLSLDTFDSRVESSAVSLASSAMVAPNLLASAPASSVIGRIVADLTPLQPRLTATATVGAGHEASPTIVLNKGLEFRVHEVRCIDETNPEWPGSDEIAMGAVMSAPSGTTTQVPEFDVGGHFDDGDRKKYSPPRVLHRFSLDGLEYPADFLSVVALAEKDSNGLSAFIKELWEAIRDEVQIILAAVGAAAGAAAGAAIGGGIGTVIGGPLGTIIGAVAGAILGALVSWLIGALKDDIFPPQAAALQLPAGNATFAGGALTSATQSLNYSAHGGKYRVYYSWKITR